MLSKIIRFFVEPVRPYGNLSAGGYLVPVPFYGEAHSLYYEDDAGDKWVSDNNNYVLLKHYLRSKNDLVDISASEFEEKKCAWLASFETEKVKVNANEYYDAILRKDKMYLATDLAGIIVYPDDIIAGLSVYLGKVGNSFYYWLAPSTKLLIPVLADLYSHHVAQEIVD